ncbi:protein-L-isoaspartate O-methyltransferase [uncultured Sphingomonas sp.]|uniref:protein-L-isoaspartate O-methyltransferase n=1 Tax=uncultured Sphingomonas sp. TaxID=158754 RepID=UPI002613563A|nr:protein-L-isoaspartate O-methyltransferase [uncultured Sphingomonas sp.]
MPRPVSSGATVFPPAYAALNLPPTKQRARMVKRIRASVGRSAPSALTQALDRALAVIGQLPREDFVQAKGRALAYVDAPQDIGYDQTISDPYIVALMTAALDLPTDRSANVLDVGTGSGYQAAVLSPLAKSVTSIEIVKPLADQARVRLAAMGYRNVTVIAGDGFAGASDRGPFDGIVVAAGASEIPAPLIAQLKVGGRIVMPIGPGTFQEQLVVGIRQPDGALQRCTLGVTGFVPLTGRGARPTAMHGLTDRSIPFCYGAALT